jgi:putative zinc finger/helix-turn-helix YgiT family protein
MNTLEKCPSCHVNMEIRQLRKESIFRDVSITYDVEAYVCPICKLEVATIAQGGATQRAMADAYRRKTGLLTGEEIQENRKRLGLTQKALADKMTVGIASIKRWEGGIIQSQAMDKALRVAFWNQQHENNYTGNRKFWVQRVKLVLRYFESLLNMKLLLKGDKMLFAAKYLWYADMVSYRETGKSMTGATYAALPFGPQLNNYKDLIDEIRKADESAAEPLTNQEKKILARIAKTFPEPRMVYDASHKEYVWKNKRNGEMILYDETSELIGLSTTPP